MRPLDRIGILRAEVTTMALTPEAATGALQMALMSIKKEHPTTKAVLAAIPANGGDYKPEPAARTALEIAWHIVASEHRFFGSVTKGFFDVTPNPKPDSLTTGAAIAKYYDDLLPQVHAALAGLSGEQLAKKMDFRGMFEMPAVAFLDLGLRHSIHHRGQLSVYLRPAGGKVPAIYGESYDSKNK
jgi:uncharacterized damage-inducible protein DinB